MALSTPSESPAVIVREIDLTNAVPGVQSTTGATVGNFRWGPVGQRVQVSNENELVDTFANPDSFNTIDFHTAAYYLKYGNNLQVVREATSVALNSHGTVFKTATDSADGGDKIDNKASFDANKSNLETQGYTFLGKFPGALGNSLKVSLCPGADSAGAVYNGWSFKGSFDAFPSTSTYASNRSGTNDEMHIVVVDQDGLFTGTPGEVLERYPFVSQASDAKAADGTSIFAKDVINNTSEYVYMLNAIDSTHANFGELAASRTFTGTATTDIELANGVNSATLTATEVASGFDLFEDKDIVEVDFLIAPDATSSAHTTIVNDLVATAAARKDCVAVASPKRSDVVGQTNAATITTNIVTTANALTNSSYLVLDANYLKVYDKFNDQFIEIPASSSTAGIMAATDRDRAPWFSPAGQRRGTYLGVTAINYIPTKAQRDTLYKAGANPVANIPGQGIVLFGDKTKLARPSAFDRINVRRLFLVLERAISRAAETVIFEFNDEFTRAEFVNIVEPLLREVQGRRGITDFRVVCDETNNTPAVIDANEFKASIFIKPARSINYVTLNFVAVRTGVEFEEVVGTV
jgi:phage tail sheath protein FI|tara:strand:- start:3426 stop:5165 length:1740 start_codon:yes stop_codon:yes gene_type:complete